MDSPFLSYIDVRHTNFLLPSLTIGEAWDLGPKYATAEDLAPVRDDLAERVSQSRRAHIPVKEPAMAELVNSSEAEFDLDEDEMVTRWMMTIGRFLPSAELASQQQERSGKDPTPPPPPGLSRKRQRSSEQPPTGLENALSRTSP